MSISRHHAEWLSLVEQSGPFLSMPVLMRVFPQGLDSRDAAAARQLADAYESWQAAAAGPSALSAQRQWFLQVLTDFLGWPADFILEGQTLPPGLEAPQPTHGETLRPDFALRHRDSGQPPVMLIHLHPLAVRLESALPGHLWKASPATRMAELLRATRIPLGLVTNGEQWMLVHAKEGETSGFASWYADLWFQEGITLRAFRSLFTLSRFFGVAADSTLAALLEESRKDQQEVTDQLGLQVRQAVEVLVQAFDRLDAATERQLLIGVDERSIYESALTVMMRLVFLFAAEERGLLLLGDRFYDEHYAVSTLCDQLRAYADLHGEEILERRSDAWCRLLATFRAVHGGVEHETMRLPAYGGTLFDPDRYPFLEGRPVRSLWRDVAAQPLAVNNRVVLHLLEALQILRVKVPGGGPAEARRISFRALDIEQIGHVYEGLLDHIARRAPDIILGLQGAKGHDPAIPLHRLESLLANGESTLLDFLEEETGRSRPALKNALPSDDSQPDAAAPPAKKKGRAARAISALFPLESILPACGQDAALAGRIAPFSNLLRPDSFGHPVIVQAGSLYVGPGSDRRSTGTHYTPKTLTEPIVQHTLDPLVYRGPAEGWPQEKWELKSPAEILALKVCDMAMGSGAFLVQTCRYLAEKLVESWERLEQSHPGEFITTPEGSLSRGDITERLLPADSEERLAIARRCISDRCLYGVDINPMAVEMAKLSLWLITLQKDRPFTFLDHALKPGDSLLGISKFEQLTQFSLDPAKEHQVMILQGYEHHIKAAVELRQHIESLPSDTKEQIERKNRLNDEANAHLVRLKLAASVLLSIEMQNIKGEAGEMARVAAHMAAHGAVDTGDVTEAEKLIAKNLANRRPFHWPLEFPEVFDTAENGAITAGFDAFVGNPPFMHGSKIAVVCGDEYAEFLRQQNEGAKGKVNFVVFFMRRAAHLLRTDGSAGLIFPDTVAEGGDRLAGPQWLLDSGANFYNAETNLPWPGVASVIVTLAQFRKGAWHGEHRLNGVVVPRIDSRFEGDIDLGTPVKLGASAKLGYLGVKPDSLGFTMDEPRARAILQVKPEYGDVLKPYVSGVDLNRSPVLAPERYIIDFTGLTLDEARAFPELLAQVEEQVKPDCPWQNWWHFNRPAAALNEVARTLDAMMVSARVTKFLALQFAPTSWVFADKVVAVPSKSWGVFGTLSSTLHFVWAEVLGTNLGGTFNYQPTECIATFPLPIDMRSLESLAERYHEHRRQLMLARGEGLTKTYNRFHDPCETAPDIIELRALHRDMDIATATAYGWADLTTSDRAALAHGFHETKQGLRYTLSPASRREILVRLLALNRQRRTEEEDAGLHDKKKPAGKRTAGKKSADLPGQVELPFTVTPPMLEDDWSALAQPRKKAREPHSYACSLLRALLSEAGGAMWLDDLRDSFVRVVSPARMMREAPDALRNVVDRWVPWWSKEKADSSLFRPALEHMAANQELSGYAPDTKRFVLQLNDGPKPPATDAVGCDARLALRVKPARPVPEEIPLLEPISVGRVAELAALLTAA
jgi:hypothetical protein